MSLDRGSGPGVMSDAELRAWMMRHPTGAMCVLKANGRLEATPVRVHSGDGATVTVVVASPGVAEPGGDTRDRLRACIVADEFESYEGIRGVILQGSVAPEGAIVDMTVERMTTFSFARPGNGTAPR